MVRIFEETTSKVKYQSKNRLTSLLLNIPAKARDFLELKHGDTITWELHVENNKKYIKLYKKEL